MAKTQLRLTAQGFQTIDFSDEEVMAHFKKDIDVWWENLVADGDKLEYIRAPEYTGPVVPAK